MLEEGEVDASVVTDGIEVGYDGCSRMGEVELEVEGCVLQIWLLSELFCRDSSGMMEERRKDVDEVLGCNIAGDEVDGSALVLCSGEISGARSHRVRLHQR